MPKFKVLSIENASHFAAAIDGSLPSMNDRLPASVDRSMSMDSNRDHMASYISGITSEQVADDLQGCLAV